LPIPIAHGARALRAIVHMHKKNICTPGAKDEPGDQAMKNIVAGLALAMIAAVPAYAANHHISRDNAAGAYASVDQAYVQSPQVVFEGKVVGADPDPNVRLSLRRDPGLQAN
jgi:hypothetical protein